MKAEKQYIITLSQLNKFGKILLNDNEINKTLSFQNSQIIADLMFMKEHLLLIEEFLQNGKITRIGSLTRDLRNLIHKLSLLTDKYK